MSTKSKKKKIYSDVSKRPCRANKMKTISYIVVGRREFRALPEPIRRILIAESRVKRSESKKKKKKRKEKEDETLLPEQKLVG